MHITLVGRDLVDFELYYGLYILGFRYTISESATPGKRQAAPHGTRRIREKGRWPLPMVDSGAFKLAASQPRRFEVRVDQGSLIKSLHAAASALSL